jgi:hypothetical protein
VRTSLHPILFGAILLAGCSSTGTNAAATSATTSSAPAAKSERAEGHERAEAHEHGDLGASLNAFHEVLAPLWHATKGDARTGSTCDAASDLHERALAVDSGGPPANAADPDGYKANAKALVVAVDDLGTECQKSGRPDFDAKFSKVHDAFHAVMASSAPK